MVIFSPKHSNILELKALSILANFTARNNGKWINKFQLPKHPFQNSWILRSKSSNHFAIYATFISSLCYRMGHTADFCIPNMTARAEICRPLMLSNKFLHPLNCHFLPYASLPQHSSWMPWWMDRGGAKSGIPKIIMKKLGKQAGVKCGMLLQEQETNWVSKPVLSNIILLLH